MTSKKRVRQRIVILTAVVVAVLAVAACTVSSPNLAAPADVVDDASIAAEVAPAAVPAVESTLEPTEPTAAPLVSESLPTPTAQGQALAEPEQAPLWQVKGHVNPVAESVAARFSFDAEPNPLGRRFFPDDGVAARDLDACFDRELRAAIGDDAVASYAPVTESEARSDNAVATRLAGSEALLACLPARRIRAETIVSRVASWNLYAKPSAAPPARPQDQCVQDWYSDDLAVFAEQWLAVTEGTRSTQGTCLVYPVYKDVVDDRVPAGEATESGRTLAGNHSLTLQWISWEPDEWGQIVFDPLGGERYSVEGRQNGPERDYVAIEGVITRVSDVELRLQGSVHVSVSFLNGGAICVRTGGFTFLATGTRKFWRLQDQLNCDGQTTDYVDIYFG